jgi:hypothetical protein
MVYYIQYIIHPIRAREIPTCCGENPDWVWAKAAFIGFGNLWLFPTNYRECLACFFSDNPIIPPWLQNFLLVESTNLDG